MNWKSLLLGLMILGIVFAQTGAGDEQKIKNTLDAVKRILCDVFPIAIMLGVVSAAILYTVGQMTPADVRARMNQWANGLIIGTIAAGLIYVVVPWILNQLTGQNFSCH
jgi:Na+-driven multidrug efflux pump